MQLLLSEQQDSVAESKLGGFSLPEQICTVSTLRRGEPHDHNLDYRNPLYLCWGRQSPGLHQSSLQSRFGIKDSNPSSSGKNWWCSPLSRCPPGGPTGIQGSRWCRVEGGGPGSWASSFPRTACSWKKEGERRQVKCSGVGGMRIWCRLERRHQCSGSSGLVQWMLQETLLRFYPLDDLCSTGVDALSGFVRELGLW